MDNQIHINFAVSSAGRMGIARGARLLISSREDWRRVHRLREHYDAVGVGAATWIRDRPKLTARSEHLLRAPRRQPDRVIFAGDQHCLVEDDDRRTFVIGSRRPSIQRSMTQRSVIFLPVSGRSFAEPLQTLRGWGIQSLLIEGGATLLESFVAAGCFDCITAFVPTKSAGQAIEVAKAAVPGVPNMGADRLAGGILLSAGEPDAAVLGLSDTEPARERVATEWVG